MVCYTLLMKNANIPKGILFDMDGVLLVPTQPSEQNWQQVCQQFAPSLGLASQVLENALRESRLAYRKDIEHDAQKQRRDRLEPFETRRETVERGLEHLGTGDWTLATEMVRAYEAIREKRELTPSALETLQKLRDRAIPLALISNGNATYQRRKIEQHHLASFFDVILIEEEFGAAKPDQRIFLAALEQLHITAKGAWMIGDDLACDIAAAQQLGIFAIWCDVARHGLPEGNTIQPDRIIHMLLELFDLEPEAISTSSIRTVY